MTTDIVPVNIYKDKEDPPIKDDSEYPDWLWELVDPQPTLKELTLKYEQEGEDALTQEEVIL